MKMTKVLFFSISLLFASSSEVPQKMATILQHLPQECFMTKHGIDPALIILGHINIGPVMPNSGIIDSILSNITITGIPNSHAWVITGENSVDMRVNEIIITAEYSLNGTIANTFPIDEDGHLWISFRNLILSLRFEKDEELLQVDETDFGSSTFVAKNDVSERSTVNSEFDRIIFWKIIGAIWSKFERELNDCSRSAVQELLKGGNKKLFA